MCSLCCFSGADSRSTRPDIYTGKFIYTLRYFVQISANIGACLSCAAASYQFDICIVARQQKGMWFQPPSLYTIHVYEGHEQRDRNDKLLCLVRVN